MPYGGGPAGAVWGRADWCRMGEGQVVPYGGGPVGAVWGRAGWCRMGEGRLLPYGGGPTAAVWGCVWLTWCGTAATLLPY